MRTKAEIKAEITAKRKELIDLEVENTRATDIDAVKDVGERLLKVRDELNALIEELAVIEDSEGRAFNPTETYGSTRSFMMNGGVNAPKDAGVLTRDKSLSSRITEGRGLDLGKYVRGIVTGDWSNASEERATMTTSALGAVIPKYLSAQIIDRARNVSLFTSAGVPVYPMDGNNLTLARVSEDPTFSWKAEGAEGADGSFNMDSVELKAKTAYGYAYVSLETIHSAVNLSDILYRVFAGAMAEAIDTGFLYGAVNGPSGILEDSDINVITATNKGGYDDLIKGVGAVRKNNGTPSAVAINATTEEILNLHADNNGVYQGVPGSLSDMDWIVSNSLKADVSEGSDALVFDPNALAIGMQSNIVVRMVQDSDDCIKKGLVGFQIYAMMDSAVLYPKHVAKITGIKPTA